ncbi:MAG: glycogen synthase [Candidatus Gastranaerophilales bacterium]|nr:glycogen synthase [Candidatus Gastranaerophilales bacterium]
MKILFASFEVAPYMKVGGLADVMGSLPSFIEKLGHQVAIFAPFIGSIDCQKYKITDVPNSKIRLKFGISEYFFTLKMAKVKDTNINIFFIDNKKYFSCFDKVYPSCIDDRYEQERFIVFSRAVLEYAKLLNFKPSVLHCNDWHTSMIPVYLKSTFKNDDFYKNTKTVLSIHNLAYQGRYFEDILDFAGIDKQDVFNSDGVEHFGSVIWLKGAINYTDKIIAVSPRYSKEIMTPEYGEGLDWALKKNKDKVVGILNGVDYSVFNPETDPYVDYHYSPSNMQAKLKNKKEILNYFGLPFNEDRPLIGIVSRLVEQKGFDLFEPIESELKNVQADIVILGTGDKKYEDFLAKLASECSNIKVCLEYKVDIGQKIYAGADMFLMPSRFEPCGLSQLIALKYGTIPIVRATGGLDDTIVGYPLDNSNGFKFWRYEAFDMLEAIQCAINTFHYKHTWSAMMNSAMHYQYSWDKSAVEYSNLYNDVTC